MLHFPAGRAGTIHSSGLRPQAQTQAPQFGALYPANRDFPEDRFYPPKPNRAVLWTAKQLAHWLGARPMDFELKISRADRDRLRALVKGPDSVIVTPNHAHLLDVLSILELSRQTQVNFVAIGAIELFERRAFGKTVTLSGSLLQRLGIFSVNRGAKDKSLSLNTAKQVVQAGEYPFMIFPEGHVSWTNQEITPLKHGAAHTAISVVRNGKNVQVVPLAFFYDNQGDLPRRILEHMDALERLITPRLEARGISVPPLTPDMSAVDRIHRLLGLMVSERELQYGLAVQPHGDPYVRLESLKQQVLERLERQYLGTVRSGTTEIRARRLIGAVSGQRRDARNALAATPKTGWPKRQDKAQKQAYETQNARWAKDIDTLGQLMQLSMYPADYLDGGDPNRMIETLFKVDRDLNQGKEPAFYRFWRHVTAHVKVGEPIDVARFLSSQEIARLSDDDLVEQALSGKIQAALQAEIDRMAGEVNAGKGLAR